VNTRPFGVFISSALRGRLAALDPLCPIHLHILVVDYTKNKRYSFNDINFAGKQKQLLVSIQVILWADKAHKVEICTLYNLNYLGKISLTEPSEIGPGVLSIGSMFNNEFATKKSPGVKILVAEKIGGKIELIRMLLIL
jgi:hypothetical protein